MLGSRRFSATACSLACSLGLLVAGCRAKAERVAVGRIVIDAPREYDQPAGGRDAVRAAISERLKDDDTTTLEADEREASHVLHVRIGAAFEGGGKEEGMEVAERPLHLRLRPVGSAPLYEVVSRARGGDPVASALAAFDDAWAVLRRERILEVGGDDDLVKALEDSDGRIRDFAIVRLGDRKTSAAVDPLCKLLEREERPELVLRAIGSLVAIGDARAVEPLIELSSRKDPDFVLQIIFAVGSIGGRTAEAYLVTMASGHPVEAIRRGAEQALGEMKQRTAKR
jgi:hypothetical protein